MPNKPKYIVEIETRMESFEKRMETSEGYQDKILTRTGEIHTALMGTEYDKTAENGNGGGIVKRLGRIEKKCDNFQSWKTRLTATNTIVWLIVSAGLTGIWTVIVVHWQHIIK